MDWDREHLFWAMRKALFRQSKDWCGNLEKKDAPKVFCMGRLRRDKALVDIDGTIDLDEMITVVIDDLRRHDRTPRLIELAADAILAKLLNHVVADPPPPDTSGWIT